MKKWGILIGGLIFGFIFMANAQTDMGQLFSSNNQNIVYSGQAKDYSGSPLVFIEGISDKPQPKDWKDELKIKLFGSMEIPQPEIQKPLPPLEQQNNIQNSLKINSFFGGEKEVAFVPHTSDWNFIIQLMNDEEILIREDIQFIKTADVPTPKRTWANQNLTLIEAKLNGHDITEYQAPKGNDIITLNFPELESGVHRLHLVYLIKDAGIFSKKTAKLSLSLSEMGWSLPTDSLKGIVLFPQKINHSAANFLLGKNKKEIKEAFEVQTDKSGALFFRATHLMPANSIIRLNLDLGFDSFVKNGFWNRLISSTSDLIFWVSLIVILGYLILNIVEIKIASADRFIFHKKYFPQNTLGSFFKRTGEIWIGLILLWGSSLGILYFTNSAFSNLESLILFLIPVVFVLVMDYLLLNKMKGNK